MTSRPTPRSVPPTLALLLAALLLIGAPAASLSQDVSVGGASPSYDVVVRNGKVLDGAGNPWIRADVAIRDGRFVRIGRVPERGKREIDATGLYVSPGWIDMMDQSGSVLLRNGLAENKLRMGVTTAIGGEGGTPSLSDPDEPRAPPAEEIPEYFRRIEDGGISINFGTYYSETQARVQVLGYEDRPPDEAELEQMKDLMGDAMEAGALGMTTALIYPPSSYASTDELVAVARVAGEMGGIYASHIRDEGEGLVTAVREAIEIGERGHLPVEIFHFKAAYSPGWGTLIQEAIDTVEAARSRGVDVAADLYPYTAGGTGLEATIPSWAHDGGRDALRRRLDDPETRERLKGEVETGSPGWWNIVESSGGWDNIVMVNARNEANRHLEGKNLTEIAGLLGKDPRDAAWDLVLQGEGRVMAIYHMMSEEDVATALARPWVSVGSDAGAVLNPGQQDGLGLPHPRSYGTFPRVLHRFVKELGTLELEDAIRQIVQ